MPHNTEIIGGHVLRKRSKDASVFNSRASLSFKMMRSASFHNNGSNFAWKPVSPGFCACCYSSLEMLANRSHCTQSAVYTRAWKQSEQRKRKRKRRGKRKKTMSAPAGCCTQFKLRGTCKRAGNGCCQAAKMDMLFSILSERH